jgi:hypothetical protein
MRILFVAPTTANLNTGSELARIATGLTPTILDGVVDRKKLELALKAGRYDVVHFAGHGSAGALFGGEIEAEELAGLLSYQQKLHFVFINACNSVAIAIAVHNRLHVPIIAHDAPIDDEVAIRFAEAFYRDLAQNGGDLVTAMRRARETLARLFGPKASIPQLVDGDMASDLEISECMSYVRRELGAMRSDMETNYTVFNAKLDAMSGDITRLSLAPSKWERWIVVILLALLVAQVITPVLNGMLVR